MNSMLAIDANILLYAYVSAAPENSAATVFLQSLQQVEAVAISEFTLAEFYLLLRNPAILLPALTSEAATAVIQAYRQHPLWKVLGFPPAGKSIHDQMWSFASSHQFARRRLYDVRVALCLRAFGVKEFATANVKDFKDLGFKRVFNPLLS